MGTTVKATREDFVPGTSRGPRNAATFALQMARERQRQLEMANRIKELRGAKPQPVVADEVGVRLRTYQHWEAGDGIAWENLQRLAKLFGVSENYLLYGLDEPIGPESQLDRIEKQGAASAAALADLSQRLQAIEQQLRAERKRRNPPAAGGRAASHG